MSIFICQFCGRETTNAGANKAHENKCINNPNPASYRAGRAPGYKGENQFTKAARLGLPKPEISSETRKKLSISSKKQKHSIETKAKISKARIKYLAENPDMVPYKLNHYSKGRSYPEKYWKEILDKTNLKYVEQFQIHTYQLDFAFVDQKIDLEIDGDQHYLDKRIVESDKRRNRYLEDLGWTVIRVKWSEYKSLDNKQDYVNNILTQLGTGSV